MCSNEPSSNFVNGSGCGCELTNCYIYVFNVEASGTRLLKPQSPQLSDTPAHCGSGFSMTRCAMRYAMLCTRYVLCYAMPVRGFL